MMNPALRMHRPEPGTPDIPEPDPAEPPGPGPRPDEVPEPFHEPIDDPVPPVRGRAVPARLAEPGGPR
ncbi:hypothetical protein [Burkholderia gladioli]|jgi:hypothetical protein|uniref:hypothetical protein n=1 Tax=Burkholderia gladioli TaxID=28095 RepID=UPI000F524B21|nr:hypothetical protein [Burkholderia gladioli]